MYEIFRLLDTIRRNVRGNTEVSISVADSQVKMEALQLRVCTYVHARRYDLNIQILVSPRHLSRLSDEEYIELQSNVIAAQVNAAIQEKSKTP